MQQRPGSLILAALVAALFAAAPAAADETLGLGAPAAVDGVVTSWTVTGATGQTVRLRSTQALQGGGTGTTATSDPVTVTAAANTARLPIGAGGRLALLDATGSPTVSARVEPDADGDAYGDTTQDACPGNAADHTAPCDATRTFGSPLTLAPSTQFSGGALEAFQLSAAGTTPAAPIAGVVTRLRLRADPAKGTTVLQVLRPATAGTYVIASETAPVSTTGTGVTIVPAQVAIQQGDRLAFRSVGGDPGPLAYLPQDGAEIAAPRTRGQTWTPDTSTPESFRVLVQADVEPDADQDGRGDVTQDEVADLALTGTATARTLAGSPFTQAFTVKNLGPEIARDVVVTLKAPANAPTSPTPGVACAADLTCRIAALAPGASLTVTPTYVFPAIYPPPSGTLTSRATVAAATPDPDHANDAEVTLTTILDPVGGIATPPPAAPPGLCAHVIRGTRDDDVLRGTAFPDRLVGGDGGDLLKGLGADDCLEGGAGNDVLDGGDGSDRVAGASGRDRLIGGKGNDALTGGKGNDRLFGGAGDDTLSPGAGHDAIDGGAGNDTINSVDGVRETVVCGAGRDTVRADRRDRLRGCERITRKR